MSGVIVLDGEVEVSACSRARAGNDAQRRANAQIDQMNAVKVELAPDA